MHEISNTEISTDSLAQAALEHEKERFEILKTPQQGHRRHNGVVDPEADELLEQLNTKKVAPDSTKKKFYSDFLRPPTHSPGLLKITQRYHAETPKAAEKQRMDSPYSPMSPNSRSHASLEESDSEP